MSYVAFKFLHVAAVILFLGNMVTGLFWKSHGDRSSDPRVIAHTLEGLNRGDRWFTLPAIVVIVIGGVGGAIVGGLPMLRTGWIFWSIVLFILSGISFSAQAPLQRRLLEVARSGIASGSFDWAQYRSLSKRWEFWGIFALLTSMTATFLMVYKPVLPGL
jgi:uncharacterized membrane protein